MCVVHPRNQCETYCLTCRRRVCIQCTIGDHKTHDIEMLDDYLGMLAERREQGLKQVGIMKLKVAEVVRERQQEVEERLQKGIEEQY